jgi:hypothetical protein
MKTILKKLSVNLIFLFILPVNIHCQTRWNGVIKFYNYFDKYSIDITQVSPLVEWANKSANISSVVMDETNNLKIKILPELVKFTGLKEEEKYDISIEGKVDKNGIFVGKAKFPDPFIEYSIENQPKEYDIRFVFDEDGTATVTSHNNKILKLKQYHK